MTDVDHRKSEQILGVRSGRNNVVVVRDKFGVHSGLFAQCNDVLQFLVFPKSQRDRNLIQTVFRQDHDQIVDPSDHFDAFVHRPACHIVI